MPRYEARQLTRGGFAVIWDTQADQQLTGLWEEFEDACIVAERMNRNSDHRGKFREQRV